MIMYLLCMYLCIMLFYVSLSVVSVSLLISLSSSPRLLYKVLCCSSHSDSLSCTNIGL